MQLLYINKADHDLKKKMEFIFKDGKDIKDDKDIILSDFSEMMSIKHKLDKFEEFEKSSQDYNNLCQSIKPLCGIDILTEIEDKVRLEAKILENIEALNQYNSVKELELDVEDILYHGVNRLNSDDCTTESLSEILSKQFEKYIYKELNILRHTDKNLNCMISGLVSLEEVKQYVDRKIQDIRGVTGHLIINSYPLKTEILNNCEVKIVNYYFAGEFTEADINQIKTEIEKNYRDIKNKKIISIEDEYEKKVISENIEDIKRKISDDLKNMRNVSNVQRALEEFHSDMNNKKNSLCSFDTGNKKCSDDCELIDGYLSSYNDAKNKLLGQIRDFEEIKKTDQDLKEKNRLETIGNEIKEARNNIKNNQTLIKTVIVRLEKIVIPAFKDREREKKQKINDKNGELDINYQKCSEYIKKLELLEKKIERIDKKNESINKKISTLKNNEEKKKFICYENEFMAEAKKAVEFALGEKDSAEVNKKIRPLMPTVTEKFLDTSKLNTQTRHYRSLNIQKTWLSNLEKQLQSFDDKYIWNEKLRGLSDKATVEDIMRGLKETKYKLSLEITQINKTIANGIYTISTPNVLNSVDASDNELTTKEDRIGKDLGNVKSYLEALEKNEQLHDNKVTTYLDLLIEEKNLKLEHTNAIRDKSKVELVFKLEELVKSKKNCIDQTKGSEVERIKTSQTKFKEKIGIFNDNLSNLQKEIIEVFQNEVEDLLDPSQSNSSTDVNIPSKERSRMFKNFPKVIKITEINQAYINECIFKPLNDKLTHIIGNYNGELNKRGLNDLNFSDSVTLEQNDKKLKSVKGEQWSHLNIQNFYGIKQIVPQLVVFSFLLTVGFGFETTEIKKFIKESLLDWTTLLVSSGLTIIIASGFYLYNNWDNLLNSLNKHILLTSLNKFILCLLYSSIIIVFVYYLSQTGLLYFGLEDQLQQAGQQTAVSENKQIMEGIPKGWLMKWFVIVALSLVMTAQAYIYREKRNQNLLVNANKSKKHIAEFLKRKSIDITKIIGDDRKSKEEQLKKEFESEEESKAKKFDNQIETCNEDIVRISYIISNIDRVLLLLRKIKQKEIVDIITKITKNESSKDAHEKLEALLKFNNL